jgi:tRNA/tmRNA/rRNA uracil-C5-methylase (TrmA/RlmC/RlmD family)
MEVSFEKSAFGGTCLSFVDGKAVFTPFVIPGERAEVEIVTKKKDFSTAKVCHLIEASADRISPECPVFAKCGGCDYLHMSYARELSEKKEIIADSLRRIAKMRDGIPGIDMISGERFHYRSHSSVKSRGGAAGFFAKDSHDIVPFPPGGCLLLSENLLEGIRNFSQAEGEIKAAVDREGKYHSAHPGKNSTVHEELNGIVYERNIHSFFQANMLLRKAMADRVVEYASSSGRGSALELGCGSGFFTLQLAAHCTEISGVEISAEAVHSAEKNAEANGIDNAVFSCRSDETIDPVKDRADIVVADPPRAGLSDATRKAVIEMKPRIMVYVSCNPSTWARDVRDFSAAGMNLSKITFIDMFPGTQHIEIISLLES